MVKELLNSNKWNVIVWVLGFVFACGMFYVLCNNTDARSKQNVLDIKGVCEKVGTVSDSVIKLSTDVEYIKKGIDRIEKNINGN